MHLPTRVADTCTVCCWPVDLLSKGWVCIQFRIFMKRISGVKWGDTDVQRKGGRKILLWDASKNKVFLYLLVLIFQSHISFFLIPSPPLLSHPLSFSLASFEFCDSLPSVPTYIYTPSFSHSPALSLSLCKLLVTMVTPQWALWS